MFRGAFLSFIGLVTLAACGDSTKPAEPKSAPVAAVAPAAAAPFDPVTDATGSYRVRASIAPAEVKKGAKAKLDLDIEMTRPDVHVQREFPLKATLTPSAGLTLAKATLGHADAVEPSAVGRHWVVDVTAARSGRQNVDVAIRFAICRESEPAWCVVRSDAVSATVEVR